MVYEGNSDDREVSIFCKNIVSTYVAAKLQSAIRSCVSGVPNVDYGTVRHQRLPVLGHDRWRFDRSYNAVFVLLISNAASKEFEMMPRHDC